MAHGIFPFIIGTLIWTANQRRVQMWITTGMLAVASWCVVGIAHPGRRFLVDGNGIEVRVSGQRLLVDASTAADISLLRDLKQRLAAADEAFIAMPTWPGAYTLFGQKSPTWEIYALLPRSPDFESREIERIKSVDPAFILIHDHALDGRDALQC